MKPAPHVAMASTARATCDQSAPEQHTLISHASFRSPIFWRIATVVFICIVFIEIILLVFSWFSERNRLLTRLDDSLALLAPIMVESEQVTELDWLLSANHADTRHPLIGYNLQRNGVLQRKNGNTLHLGTADANESGNHFNSEKGFYDSFLTVSAHNGDQLALWLRVDARHVNEELESYVYRIIGLVLLISLFVTVGCLLALTPILIRPLQKLNNLILIGQRQGLRYVATPDSALRRTDELGNVFRSFDRLRSELIASENEKNRITERFQHFADLGADSFWEVDKDFVITYAAGDIAGMFGIEAEEIRGRSVRHFKSVVSNIIPDIADVFTSLKKNGFWEGSLEKRWGESKTHTIRIIASALHDENGVFSGARGTVVDVTVASELARELKHQATHDMLTGLYNRREFDRLLETELQVYVDTGKPFCVCMLDLDRFKLVNDNCGHAAGDLLLKQLSDLIRTSVREYDIVARFGGDEFTVLLTGCDLKNGLRIAETIRTVVDDYRFYWNDAVYNVGASIGIAEVLPSLQCAKAVILAADACCIKAKRFGRNQVQAYNESDESVARHHGELQWMARITQALEEDRLLLYQQPIVPVKNIQDEEIHFEILLRLTDDDGVVYSPNEFLPAAERYSFIDKIDRWVVNRVISWLEKQSIRATTPLCVNINLSGMTVSDDSFQSFLYEKLHTSSVNAEHLCFEITESAAMRNTGKTVDFLNGVRELGCRIALDDFGTGFSSLSHIQELPIDYIKIDGVFIRDIVDNPLDQALVKSITDVAKILNVKTVAEFVESDTTLRVLEELSVDYAQGYLFASPEVLTDSQITYENWRSAA